MSSLFARRLKKEKACSGFRDLLHPIISINPKTDISLNLPVKNCVPTPACASNCYSCQGPMMFEKSVEKTVAVDRWILLNPKWAAKKTAEEVDGSTLRLSGSGDMTPDHIPYVKEIVKLGVRIYGFTRRPDTWTALNDIGVEFMFSIDVTMDKKCLLWAITNVPKNRLAYCRRPGDPDWSFMVGVTFPEHGPETDNALRVPGSITDCPAIRKHVTCDQCRFCY